MTSRKPANFFFMLLLITSALVSQFTYAQESRPQGSKGLWHWSGVSATTDFKHGISLSVLFLPQSGCNDAMFVISGNDQVQSISFTIDGQGYNQVAVENKYIDGTPFAGFVLSDNALYNLKHGYRLTIDTNAGQLTASLSGSGLAFNNAYGNCMSEIAPPLLQTTPSRHAQQTGKKNETLPTSQDKIKVVEATEGKRILLFSGEFVEGDAQLVIQGFRDTGASILILDSPGGLISEAQMVGYYLRSNNIDAFVADTCASACTFALAGGVGRGAFENSQIGVHRSYLKGGGGNLEDGQRLASNYLRYFRSMGVDPEVVAIAGNVSSDSIQWLNLSEAKRLGLIQEIIREAPDD